MLVHYFLLLVAFIAGTTAISATEVLAQLPLCSVSWLPRTFRLWKVWNVDTRTVTLCVEWFRLIGMRTFGSCV
jgi:hypothetical protein